MGSRVKAMVSGDEMCMRAQSKVLKRGCGSFRRVKGEGDCIRRVW